MTSQQTIIDNMANGHSSKTYDADLDFEGYPVLFSMVRVTRRINRNDYHNNDSSIFLQTADHGCL